MEQSGARKPSFLWRGILILLPLILLAGMGLYSLRSDRALAEVEARERCEGLAEFTASQISDHLLERTGALVSRPPIFARILLDTNGQLVSINGSRERAQIPRDPVPRLSTDDSGAQAKYDAGLSLAEQHKINEAVKSFRDVRWDRQAVTASGIPLRLLAEWQLVRIAADSKPRLKWFYNALDSAWRDEVNTPSFLTGVILGQLEKVDDRPDVARKWMDTWRKDEAARDFYVHVRSDMTQPVFWTKWAGRKWLVLLRPMVDGVEMFPVDEIMLVDAVKSVIANSSARIEYAQPRIELAGTTIVAPNSNGPLLGSARKPLLGRMTGILVVDETLARPDLLYAQQRTRTAWFAALILVSAMAAVVGLVSSYRGFQQQLRLNEMKSNFVSSVSHELRAPIASMRLLAESLERGKVPEETKRHEYYGFLVQESRRLSSLIENILDFSRIEQGRKKYQFEAADLDFLVEQTVKLMQPCATEHEVVLQLEKNGGAGPMVVRCDGLAVQQAMINLIDNAIKHSPKGAVVKIGTERGPAKVRLWVEDRGPGIPKEEHERIFERFYRLGSELRRETQGIGIGLSIVKHTVEAHGGRVTVQSVPGQGSRFTIELPDRE